VVATAIRYKHNLITFDTFLLPILTEICVLFVLGGLVWILCKENIREIYCVDKETMQIALGIGVASFLLLLLILFISFN
jgi:hypothetical protein